MHSLCFRGGQGAVLQEMKMRVRSEQEEGDRLRTEVSPIQLPCKYSKQGIQSSQLRVISNNTA